MHITLEQLSALMKAKEAEHLEFKEAKERFDFEKLVRYCVALANEGGGRIVLGVTDKKPRHVVGTQAFSKMERTKAGLLERLHVRVETDVIDHPNGRVLVFTVPPRPIGMPIHYKGAYWMRSGEDLVPMTPDMLKKSLMNPSRIFLLKYVKKPRKKIFILKPLKSSEPCGAVGPAIQP